MIHRKLQYVFCKQHDTETRRENKMPLVPHHRC